ncbi:MAG: DUF72 domain-containing protein [Candidatus Atribacteria bacterium]|nr:DUF72 domain-containing protein [Candidatus Atribacteria bacterium]
MLYIGTSGFSYQDWVGPFYPKNTQKGEMLPLYARQFNAVEINSSYYRIPPASVFYHLQRKVPDSFKFSIKANQEITHVRGINPSILQEFKMSLEPLLNSGKLGCILAQFPYSFHYSKANQDYLRYLKENIGDIPLIVEFRNAYWAKEEVFNFLRKNEIGFCTVDQPSLVGLLPPLAEATSRLGYIRFHGRNKEKWWQHEYAYQRYDYLYNEQELKEWVPKIKQVTDKTTDQYIFMNNHYKGKAVKNALMLMDLLRQEIRPTIIKDHTKKDMRDTN